MLLIGAITSNLCLLPSPASTCQILPQGTSIVIGGSHCLRRRPVRTLPPSSTLLNIHLLLKIKRGFFRTPVTAISTGRRGNGIRNPRALLRQKKRNFQMTYSWKWMSRRTQQQQLDNIKRQTKEHYETSQQGQPASCTTVKRSEREPRKRNLQGLATTRLARTPSPLMVITVSRRNSKRRERREVRRGGNGFSFILRSSVQRQPTEKVSLVGAGENARKKAFSG